MTDVDFLKDARKKHDIPLENLDFKYVKKCENVKELEKIYRVLISGVEGKYPDLENFVYEKIKTLSPNSRVLRKDKPIYTKQALSKSEQEFIDSDIQNFVKEIPNLEKKVTSKIEVKNEDKEPPIRSAKQTNIIKSGNTKPLTQETKNSQSAKKSVKPKDYREWEKIEKQIDKELEEKENLETISKVADDRTAVNHGKNFSKSLVKDLPKDINIENLDESTKILKADQEKCKGNESFAAACYHEAVTYYTRSIKYLPTAASYNNRALAYIKLENWEKAILDCNEVLIYEQDNFKALLRRATALYKQKNFEKAKIDIEKCLILDSSDKKAKELKNQIDHDFRKNQEEIEKLKSAGGKRLQIEETDGSDEESDEENKNIPIAEVDSDSEEEDQVIEVPIKSEEKADNESSKTSTKLQEETEKESVLEVKKFELPEHIIQTKDKAGVFFTNGQYADAIDYYTKSIDFLQELKKNSDLLLEIDQNLSVLFNNRASSYQNICDFKNCIKDCESGLEIVEDNVSLKCKLLFKKANSLEMLEKYEQAFEILETLMKIDNKFKNVQLNYNRVKGILKENGKLDKVRNLPQVKKVERQEDQQKLFEDFKTKGNDFFKNNNYQKACELYSKCIEIDGGNTIAYSNRSLCYIKLKLPDLAIQDTSYVLGKEPNNVKALYRRALAYKDKKEFESAINDLRKILSIEYNNQIAKNELQNLEILIKEEQKIVNEKKVKIEEISENDQVNSEKESKPIRKPVAQPAPILNIPKKNYDFSSITNGYEFLQAWNSISPTDIENYSKLIASVNPNHLHKFIGSKLDDDMLSKLIKCVHKLSEQELTTNFDIYDYLESITKTQRFEITKMFINKDQKKFLSELIGKIDKENRLKKLYSI
ncbi:sperm-associated antigen 1 [Brachionus plicatilis]|uniref:Sperm-associated antigen 1 n=1 Tax=Brachionus plicatilis TaxID=10195 RepID=A0A3M7RPD1_BRAPC|nr:sperm-associated antigen 1 [Brachionus plicatilis]